MAKSWSSDYKIVIMQKSLTIIGAGAWGSALAIILSDKFDEIFLIYIFYIFLISSFIVVKVVTTYDNISNNIK